MDADHIGLKRWTVFWTCRISSPLTLPIGLAEHGGQGLKVAREIYAGALEHLEELCAPYATVVDIDRTKLPTAGEVNGWTGAQYVRALRHNQGDPLFNLLF